jgi:hypothetical protein
MSTGAGPRIFSLFHSVCAPDLRLTYLLGPYTLNHSPKGSPSAQLVPLLLASVSRNRLSCRSQRRTFPKFGSVKLQGSEDPMQKPVHIPLVACLYTNRQEKKVK